MQIAPRSPARCTTVAPTAPPMVRTCWPLLFIVTTLLHAPLLAQEAVEASNDEAAETAAELPVRLLDREPFDRITLDAANDNAVIETVLLDLADRQVSSPLPRGGPET